VLCTLDTRNTDRAWSVIGTLLTWLLLMLIAAVPTQAAVLEVFVRSDCPHCAAAKEYLPTFAQEQPGLEVVVRTVDRDPQALEDLIRYSRMAGIWPPGVPAFVVQGRVLVGFDTPASTGPKLALLIDNNSASTTTVEAPLFGVLDVSRLGLPLFTLALGLLDGFNPCAMWVLLFLLSLLVHLRDRRRMALIAGTFVLVSGAVYFLFMSAWLNVFRLVGFSDVMRWGLGAVALAIGAVNINDALRAGAGFTLSIPTSAKPGLYARMRNVMNTQALLPALIGVASLAVVVNGIELLCTAGFPAIYTAVLTQQELSPAAHYAYLGLYILGYIADDSLMVATAVIALSSRKLTERAGRWLKLLSGAVMAALGAVMLLRPEWLL
jgi:glutaredoxin